MTTLAAARTALVTAVGAKDDAADPPFSLVFSDGAELAGTLKGQILWRFRVTCAVALNSDNATGDVLMNAYLSTQIAALQALAGWALVSLSPTGVASWAGSDLLTADIAVSTYVTLS